MTESPPEGAVGGPHYTHTEPSQKMDARGLAEGVCTCGYRTSPATFSEAAKRVRAHFEAKHSHESQPPLPTRSAQAPCRHCGKTPEADGDHTCPCPHRDDECPDHPPARCPSCGTRPAVAGHRDDCRRAASQTSVSVDDLPDASLSNDPAQQGTTGEPS